MASAMYVYAIAGPDPAMRNAVRGSFASLSRRAMPPNNHSFTPSTLSPALPATTACVSS